MIDTSADARLRAARPTLAEVIADYANEEAQS